MYFFECFCAAQVDDKYQYSCENKDNRVHGWISSDNTVGFWVITPSDEFRTGGPLKQDLTSHVGPTSLAVSHIKHQNIQKLLDRPTQWLVATWVCKKG